MPKERRKGSWKGAAALGAALALALACVSAPPPPASEEPLPRPFSGERAFGHLEALAGLGPRVTGSQGARAARDYVRAALEAQGLEVETLEAAIEVAEGEKVPLESLRAVVPGESSDVLVLAAPLDTAPAESFELVGANEGASGAAVLLELARVLQEEPLPYTVWLVFLDGELGGYGGFLGSRTLAHELAASGDLARLRLLVWIHQVGDRDLAIARDLRSDRGLRDAFFTAGRRLGHESAFPADASFEEVVGGHLAFEGVSFRRFVALVDPRYGGSETPGDYWRTAEDTPERCAPESLEAVGNTTLLGLRTLSARMAKVDRLADVPAAEEPDPEPDPEDVGEVTGEGDAGHTAAATGSDPQP